MARPLIGITADVYRRGSGRLTARVATSYAERVAQAGGTPVVLTPVTDPDALYDLAARFDGFVFTGGDDPRTEPFGVPTDPRVTPVFEERQSFESGLLGILLEDAREHEARGGTPVLGVCLGMQMMALHAGGSLFQHMPESHPETHARHWAGEHEILPEPGVVSIATGVSHSHHRQAVRETGSLAVLARAPDGVIEAVGDPARAYWVGVQWHPERTGHAGLGQRLFDELVRAARSTRV
ncbi:MAG: gamma-glutamyl-gamma-aminobutyrate hydrolase family protein [Phycisphaerales bacterium JB040]